MTQHSLTIFDGLRNTKFAVLDLMDESATTYDQRKIHPLIKELQDFFIQVPWIADVGIRMRDQGHVFHVEVFVTTTTDSVSTKALIGLTKDTMDLNWKLQDVVIIPVQDIPPNTHARYSRRPAEQ